MRGEGGVAGEGSVVRVSKFHSWDKPLTNINSDVQRFLCPVYYIASHCIIYIIYITRVLYFASWSVIIINIIVIIIIGTSMSEPHTSAIFHILLGRV